MPVQGQPGSEYPRTPWRGYPYPASYDAKIADPDVHRVLFESENIRRGDSSATFRLSVALQFVQDRVHGRLIMPVYDYICKDCNKTFEKIITLAEHEKEAVSCPYCRSKHVEQEATAFFAVTSSKS
jgi:putative FmdB family regulatory protein